MRISCVSSVSGSWWGFAHSLEFSKLARTAMIVVLVVIERVKVLRSMVTALCVNSVFGRGRWVASRSRGCLRYATVLWRATAEFVWQDVSVLPPSTLVRLDPSQP